MSGSLFLLVETALISGSEYRGFTLSIQIDFATAKNADLPGTRTRTSRWKPICRIPVVVVLIMRKKQMCTVKSPQVMQAICHNRAHIAAPGIGGDKPGGVDCSVPRSW